MGIGKSKRYYASAVQLVAMTETATPYQQIMDYNMCYLDGQIDIVNWCTFLMKSGKSCFNQYANWLNHQDQTELEKAGLLVTMQQQIDTGGNLTIPIVDAILKDIGINPDEIEDLAYNLINPSDEEITWVKYNLNWDWDNDNIVIDAITYTYKYHEWKDLSTIIVHLSDRSGNILDKEVPTFHQFAGSGETIKASYYICISYTKNDITYEWMQRCSINDDNTENTWKYTTKDGTVLDYTTEEQPTLRVLPLIPIKQGGYWHENWHHPPDPEGIEGNARLTAWRISPKKYGNEDMATSCSEELRKKFSSSSQKKNLYKKARFTDQCDYYKIYKKACKKFGSDIRSQIGIPYDVMCQISASKGSADQVRELLYDCYTGFGCPLQGIRAGDVEIVDNEEFETRYAELLKDTKHPWRAVYAKYSRYTDDEFFSVDRDSDGKYHHNHFGVINNKTYKKPVIRAIGQYMYKFFDKFTGTPNGKDFTFTHKQGKNYNSIQTWTQFKKRKVQGKCNSSWWYDFEYSRTKQFEFVEVEFTGEYEDKYVCERREHGTPDNPQISYTSYIVSLPIYSIKEYLIEFEENLEDNTEIEWDYGTPIYENYYVKDNKEAETWKYVFEKQVLAGNLSQENPILRNNLTVTNIQCKGIKRTTKVRIGNIPFSNITYNVPIVEDIYNTDGDGNVQVIGTKGDCFGGFVKKGDKIEVGVFEDMNEWIDVDTGEWSEECDINYRNVSGKTACPQCTTSYNLEQNHTIIALYNDQHNPDELYPDAAHPYLPVRIYGENETSTFQYWYRYGLVLYSKRTPVHVYPEMMALSKEGKNYILYNKTENYSGENIVMRYQKKIDENHYYEIMIKNYNIDWRINPYKGKEHKAGSFSCLAPDGIAFIPILPDIVKKSSFLKMVFIWNLSYKQYWAYWKSENVSWWVREGRGIVFSLIFIVLAVVINILTFGQAMPLTVALLVLALGLLLHFIIKIFGLEDTIVGVVLETAGQIAIGVFCGGANFVVTMQFVLFTAINFGLNMANVILTRDLEGKMNELDSERDQYKSELLKFTNLTNAATVSLVTTSGLVRRMRGIYISEYDAINHSTELEECSMDWVKNMYANYNNNYVDLTTHIALGI